jgi:hypothetical protein
MKWGNFFIGLIGGLAIVALCYLFGFVSAQPVISERQNGQKLDFISKLEVLNLLNKAAL